MLIRVLNSFDESVSWQQIRVDPLTHLALCRIRRYPAGGGFDSGGGPRGGGELTRHCGCPMRHAAVAATAPNNLNCVHGRSAAGESPGTPRSEVIKWAGGQHE
jgi:hypothetical protein